MGGLQVHRTVDHGGGGAQRQQVAEIDAGGQGGPLRILEPDLRGEDVGLEPGQQFLAVHGHGFILGQVRVEVHQSRQDPVRAQVQERFSGMGGRHVREGSHRGDAPRGIHHHGAVGDIPQDHGAMGAQQVSTEQHG